MVKTQRLRSIPSSKRQRLEKEGEGEGNRRKETESSEESESEDEVDIANNGDMENLSFSFSDFSPSFYDGVNLLVKQSIRLGYSSSMTQLVVDQGNSTGKKYLNGM